MSLFFNARSTAGDDTDLPTTIAAFGSDPETGRVLDMTLTMEGFEGAEIAVAGLSQVLRKYRAEPPPPDLIVDITGCDEPLSNLEELAALCPPSIRVFVLGTIDSIDFYRRLMALGVAGYLVKPVSPERLLDMLAHDKPEAFSTSVPQRHGKIFSVIGLQGGVGATSLAINIGWGLSQLLYRRTGLVDLDPAGGSLALDLDITPAPGFSELLADPGRLDGNLLDQSTALVADRLGLIASDTPPLETGPELSAQAMQDLVRHLSCQLSFTVLDLPRGPINTILPVLEISDIRVLVMDRRPASLRNTALLLKHHLAEAEGRTVVVLNQSRPPDPTDFTRTRIAEAIDHEIAVEIPYVKGGPVAVLSPARPLIVRRGMAARRLCDLVTDLAGLPPKQPWYTGFWPVWRSRYVR